MYSLQKIISGTPGTWGRLKCVFKCMRKFCEVMHEVNTKTTGKFFICFVPECTGDQEQDLIAPLPLALSLLLEITQNGWGQKGILEVVWSSPAAQAGPAHRISYENAASFQEIVILWAVVLGTASKWCTSFCAISLDLVYAFVVCLYAQRILMNKLY